MTPHQKWLVPATNRPLPASAIGTANTSQSCPPQDLSPLRCRKKAAEYLGVETQTLAQWATNKRYALAFVKIGRKVMYRKSDLDAFIAANTHGAEVSNG